MVDVRDGTVGVRSHPVGMFHVCSTALEGTSVKKCPACDGPMLRAIFAGFPMWLCEDEFCSCVDGVWAWVTQMLPFNGVFMVYSGPYVLALWVWLFGNPE